MVRIYCLRNMQEGGLVLNCKAEINYSQYNSNLDLEMKELQLEPSETCSNLSFYQGTKLNTFASLKMTQFA